MKQKNPKIIRCDNFVIYRRKSSDEKRESQIASLEDQNRELKELILREGIPTTVNLQEAKTAKAPGRIIFNQMLDDIEAGKASRILCWRLDRLARNPIDEGRVRWLLQENIIKEIKTPAKSYYSKDHALIPAIEFAQAAQYSRDLRTMAFRNIRSKISKGWRPGFAPLGYLNDMSKPHGQREIMPDLERFDLIKKGWELILSGVLVSKIHKIAKDEWGLRTRKTGRQGGKPLSLSQWYKIFTDPFYYGWFYYLEPQEDKENREKVLYKGSHKPMITEMEFNRVQEILGRKNKEQPKTRIFSYTGLMRCEECGSAIVADEKHQMICTECKYKFDSDSHRENCPKCNTVISEMEEPTKLHYIYYRCSRRKNDKCTQRKYLPIKQLEEQIDSELQKMDIDEDYLKLALDYLNEKKGKDFKTQEIIRQSLQKNINTCDARLKKLNNDYTSSINLDYSLYAPEEYKEQKQIIMKEKQGFENELNAIEENCKLWIELSEKTFNFCAYARYHLANGDLQRKREILSAIGENLTLKDKLLSIPEYEPFIIIKNTINTIKAQKLALEPKILASKTRKKEVFASSIPTWLRC